MLLEKLYRIPGHLLRRCQQISIAIFLEECQDDDIRPVDFAVLSALQSHSDIDQITLSRLIAVDRSSIARIVESLEQRGLIKRFGNPADRRTKCLKLTRKGASLINKVQPAVNRVQERILKPLSKSEREVFLACLEKITHTNNEFSRAPIQSPLPAKR